MLSLIAGLAVAVVSFWALIHWRFEFVLMLKGLLPLCFLMGGLVAVIAGASSLRSKPPEGEADAAEKK